MYFLSKGPLFSQARAAATSSPGVELVGYDLRLGTVMGGARAHWATGGVRTFGTIILHPPFMILSKIEQPYSRRCPLVGNVTVAVSPSA